MSESGNPAGFHWPDEASADDAREQALPGHEHDPDTSVGAGIAPGAGATTDAPADVAAARSDGQANDRGRLTGAASDSDDGRRDDDGRPIIDEPGKIQSGGRTG